MIQLLINLLLYNIFINPIIKTLLNSLEGLFFCIKLMNFLKKIVLFKEIIEQYTNHKLDEQKNEY